MNFAEKLRELREAAGMTQETLAKAAGMNKGSVANLEQGIRTKPTFETIQRLAAALGVGVEVFVGLDSDSGGAPSRGRGRPPKGAEAAPEPSKPTKPKRKGAKK